MSYEGTSRSVVMNMLRMHAPISRARIADATGLKRSTVSNIVNGLIEEGLVSENDQLRSKIGRPSINLSLRADGGAVIGLEIGVDFINIVLTNFVAETLWETEIDINPTSSQTDILTQAEDLIDQALAKAEALNLRPLGVGVGVPGLVNLPRGELMIAPNLGWNNVPLRLILSQRFRLPIYIENEANLAALGEYYFGVARGVDSLIYLSSGIGLGGGVVLDGKLFRGKYGYAGELGHIQRDAQGEKCGCGRVGCWETQVGPRAVLRRVRKELEVQSDRSLSDACQGNFDNLTFGMVVKFGVQGDEICRRAIEDVAKYLGEGIADLVNVFNPELVVIGGAFIQGKEILQPIIEATVFSSALQPSADRLRIEFSERGVDACAMGAVAIVLDDILREMTLT